MSSPLQLEHMVYERIEIAALPGHEPGAIVNVKSAVSLGSTKDLKSWRVRLTVTVSRDEEPTPPYAINIVASGAFAPVSVEDSPERIAKLVGVTGSSILYSAVRELVLLLTGRGQYGPFMLPTQSFVNLDFREAPQPQAKATSERKVAKRRKRADG